jgi:hypothetical protein
LSDQILDGNYSPQGDNILHALLHSIRCPAAHTPAPSIEPKLALKELLARIQVWDERTTTSPSGLHLGHLKALRARVPTTAAITDNPNASSPAELQKGLQHAQLNLINYSLEHGYSYDRWKDVVKL